MDAHKTRCVILTGPTGVGKSALAMRIAAQYSAEIVSADSRQIFRKLDIGTAKPTPADLAAIPHHQIDTHDPCESYSAGEYARDTLPIIKKIYEQGNLPLVTGGSGFYIEALIHPLYRGDSLTKDQRVEVSQQYSQLSNEELHRELDRIDPETADRIELNDRRRSLRYLEIYRQVGKPPSELFSKSDAELPLDYRLLVLFDEREILYQRINQRVIQMVEEGLVEEVRQLLASGSKPADNAMLSVGYREIVSHLQGELSLSDAITQIQKNSRNYAKRQLTWFRRWPDAEWIHYDQRDTVLELLSDRWGGK